MGRRCVLVFSKPPQPGRVKTRLIGELTADQTADLHRAFLEDTVQGLVPGAFDVWMSWALEEGEREPSRPAVARSIRQEGRDLGARLHHGLELAGESHDLVAAIGSDSPHLPFGVVERAFDALEGDYEVVIGPATDGGFYLIAFRSKSICKSVFEDVPWSSGKELDTVRERCRELGLALLEIERIPDIDEPQDLEYLIGLLETGEAHCPATEAVLRKWGRLKI